MTRNFDRNNDRCLHDCIVGEALDGLMVGLIITSSSGKIIWMNRAASNVLDAEPEQCIGEPITRALKDPQLVKVWHDSMDSERSVMGEVSVRYPQACELKVNCTRWGDSTGSQRGRALLFCDVTQDRAVQFEMSQEVATRLLDLVKDRGGNGLSRPVAGLTAQETRILGLVGAGLGNQEIAEQLEVTASTVRSHLKSIYRKVGLSSRAEAVSYAVKNGLA
jgi:DNA-binding CsgD family transcriptional regulator